MISFFTIRWKHQTNLSREIDFFFRSGSGYFFYLELKVVKNMFFSKSHKKIIVLLEFEPL